jgi:hypothetical protein
MYTIKTYQLYFAKDCKIMIICKLSKINSHNYFLLIVSVRKNMDVNEHERLSNIRPP